MYDNIPLHPSRSVYNRTHRSLKGTCIVLLTGTLTPKPYPLQNLCGVLEGTLHGTRKGTRKTKSYSTH